MLHRIQRPRTAPTTPAVRPHDLDVWKRTAEGLLGPEDVSASGWVDLQALVEAENMTSYNDISPVIEDIRHEYARLIARHDALQRQYAALERHATRQERLLRALVANDRSTGKARCASWRSANQHA